MGSKRAARTRTRGAAAVGVIALLVGIGAQPAAASVTSVVGSAYGYRAFNISLFGGVQTDTGPVPSVTLASNASNSPQAGSAPCGRVAYGPAILFTSDSLTVQSVGSVGTSGSVTSTSTINNINKATNTACNGVNETGGEIFTANSVTARVTASAAGKTVFTTISNGTYDVHSNYFNCTSLSTLCGRTGYQHTHSAVNSAGTTAVPSSPPANYKVAGHVHLNDTTEDFFVIVFNEQINNADGSLTVNPVHEYFGAMLDASNNIVDDPASILQGDLIIGQVVAGVR